MFAATCVSALTSSEDKMSQNEGLVMDNINNSRPHLFSADRHVILRHFTFVLGKYCVSSSTSSYFVFQRSSTGWPMWHMIFVTSRQTPDTRCLLLNHLIYFLAFTTSAFRIGATDHVTSDERPVGLLPHCR